jgi:osmoprotectant transport system permease protein
LLGPDLLPLTRQHLFLVGIAVVAAALIAIPLAIVVAAHSRLSALLLGAAGLVQTIPSLALLAVLIALMGRIGSTPALAALILYALLPILRNSCVGFAGVPAGLRDASRALGMSPGAQLRHIDLPLAMPMIIAGVRTATSISIGTATLAAFIGAGGYGERIVTGLALNDHGLLMAGALPAAMLALGSELLFEFAAARRQPPHNHRP